MAASLILSMCVLLMARTVTVVYRDMCPVFVVFFAALLPTNVGAKHTDERRHSA
jgi:hypothetical protein